MAVTATAWRGQPAWQVATGTGTSAAIVTATGAHLASFPAPGGGPDPLWRPAWPAADPARVRLASDRRYGSGGEAPLLAGLCGSCLCLPRFGPDAAGALHGEAAVASWRHAGGGRFTAHLAQTGLEVERAVRLGRDGLRLTTRVRHGGGAPRPVAWCEHITLGGPFLDGLAITAGIGTVRAPPGDQPPGSRFPHAGAGVEAAAALAMPGPADPPCGDVLSAPVLDGWWRAANPALGWALEARWSAAEFPWLVIWTEHRLRTHRPWDGRERARGLELSSEPFPCGTTANCAIPPGRWLARSVHLRWLRLG